MTASLKLALEEEPVVVIALLESFVILLIAFGVPVTPEQLGAIVAFATAVGAVLARRRVTPVGKLPST